MTEERFEEILRRFPDVTVAVVGDYFLDEYLVIDPQLAEASVETGLDAHQIVARRISPGAAGTVVGNLRALGVGEIIAAGLIGDDGHGFEMRRVFADWDVDMEELGTAAGRLTPTYTKPMLQEKSGERELNRMDIRWREALSDAGPDDRAAATMRRTRGWNYHRRSGGRRGTWLHNRESAR